MKKIVAFASAAALGLTVAACGEAAEEGDSMEEETMEEEGAMEEAAEEGDSMEEEAMEGEEDAMEDSMEGDSMEEEGAMEE